MAEEIYTQQDRVLEVHTPLDFDILLIDRLIASEAVSQPFRFEVTMLATIRDNHHLQVDPEALIGKPITVRARLASGSYRFFSGMISRFSQLGQDKLFCYYRAEAVPWTSFLTLTSDIRIFEQKSVKDIVTTIFTDNGFQSGRHFRWDTMRDYKEWDYCVQYRETDFNFVSRLLEQEGIFYYYEHNEEHQHILTLTDSLDRAKDNPQKSDFLFLPEQGIGEDEDHITAWEVRRQLVSGKWALRDFHMEMPHNHLAAHDATLNPPSPASNYELYDYPGEYAQKFNRPSQRLGDVQPEGDRVARMRAEQEDTHQLVFNGVSRCRELTAGYKIKVAGAHNQAPGKTYFLESVQHSAVQHPAYVNVIEDRAWYYRNTFSCVASTVHFRPARVTPKPLAYGPQTAFVISEDDAPNEEIWPDKFGRVRVRFPWDREAKHACWIRVAQQWAGKGWGYQWIPRVGDEVLVAFIEGDPDAPVIVGSVYNSENMPPFTLPDNKTQSGIKTKSSPHGGGENYNMFRIEDLKGKEEIYIHAEKELKTVVEADESRIVGGGRTSEIKKDDVLKITEGNRKAEITKGNDVLEVKMGGITISAPLGAYKLDAMTVEVTGKTTIKLSCGASSIEMTPAMITITSPMVKIN